MATMNISVPDAMKDWVHSIIHTGTYANASDYVRDLIRHDQEKRNKVKTLEAAITEGLQSGDSSASLDEILQQAKQELKDKK